jgi:alpha-amylase
VLDRPEDDIWEDADIVAVNRLHNSMVGTEEFLRFPTQRIAMVERGNQAVVIVNLGAETALDVATGLKDGNYVNRASTPCTLNVSSSRLKGRLPGGVIFVAHPRSDDVPWTVLRARYDVGWGRNLYVRGNKPPLSWSKGIKMRWTTGNVWVWETDHYPADTELGFKVLIDDKNWEIIDGQPLKNHKAKGGTTTEITPQFPR